MSRPPLEPGVYQEVLGGRLNYEAVIVTKPGNTDCEGEKR
jgi:hypothetical protein